MGDYTADTGKNTIAVPDTFFEACHANHVLKRSRLYLIAKCADATGQGWVTQSELRAFFLRFKSPATASRWMTALTSDDLFVFPATMTVNGQPTDVLFLRSPHDVLDRLGFHASRRYIQVRRAGLLEQHWKHEIHLAALSSRQDKPTARVTNRIRSGVGEFTQRRAEVNAKVKVHFNCRLYKANDPSAPRPDKAGVIKRGDGTIQVQLPNSYDFDECPRRVTRRRKNPGRSQLKRPNVFQRLYVTQPGRMKHVKPEKASQMLVLRSEHDGWRTWSPFLN